MIEALFGALVLPVAGILCCVFGMFLLGLLFIVPAYLQDASRTRLARNSPMEKQSVDSEKEVGPESE